MKPSRFLTWTFLLTTGCAAPQPDVKVRGIATAPVAAGIGEAEAQLALGNVGLALEGFRKVLRDRPDDVRALVGLAHCYERMSRFDLSRRYYESALANVPDDPAVLAEFAASLEQQGKVSQAAAVRAEIEQNAVAAQVERAISVDDGVEPVSLSVETIASAGARRFAPPEVAVANATRLATRTSLLALPVVPLSLEPTEPAVPIVVVPTVSRPQVASSVTVRLPPPAEPGRKPVADSRNALAARLVAERRKATGPHLERLSLGEVALVTRSEPIWKAAMVKRSAKSATFRWVAVRPVARLLNAARVQGLAARARAHLADRGWRRLGIGDANSTRAKTLVLYPAFRRGTAQRLANQFGFTQLKPFNGNEIVVLLGRDAATLKALRPA